MKLLAVEIADFRNLARALVLPGPGFNVLAGDNGQGKTNFLEAIYLLSTLASFRAARAEEQIGFGAARLSVRGRVERRDTRRLYEVEISARPVKKIARVDGKPVRASTDYFGGMNVVLFAPDDLLLPRGAPAERRRFLDRAVWNAEPRYLREAQLYQRVLKSRNAVLREGEGPRTADLLSVYDRQLADAGATIVERRRRYVEALAPRVATAWQRITGRELPFALGYHSRLTAAAGELAAELHALLAATRRRDLQRGFTGHGPHADDLALLVDGREARLHASQGQLRALVLALKIAEIAQLEACLDEPPILLLDDVTSELDAERNRHLFAFLAEVRCQVFITTTAAAQVLIARPRRDFAVRGGVIEPLPEID